jgi:DNA-binding MarR family transcriptional regulator
MLVSDLHLSPSTITRLLEKLEQKELIRRMPYEQLTVVSLTKKGWELQDTLDKCNNTFMDRCEKLLGKEETRQMTNILNNWTDKFGTRNHLNPFGNDDI